MSAAANQPVLIIEASDEARQRTGRALAAALNLPVVTDPDGASFILAVRDDVLELRQPGTKPGRGFSVDFTHLDLRTGSGSLSRKQPIVRALGRTPRTVFDATAGTGQDAFLLAALGYDVIACERSPIVAALLEDGLRRAMQEPMLRAAVGDRLRIIRGEARQVLVDLHVAPDAIYIDPMFPPKRRASALPRKEVQMLRRLVGDDADAAELFEVALGTGAKRIVVKRPHHAPPLNERPHRSIRSKLVRYDVYDLPPAVPGSRKSERV